jgi:tRNA 2-thiouridine synthesizing protein C
MAEDEDADARYDDEDSYGDIKKFIYINRKAPHGTVYALESLEVVLIAAAFDQDVSLVFMDDGVYQLKKNMDTNELEVKNFSKTYRALEMYDIDKLYVERESMEQRGLSIDDFIVDVTVLNSNELAKLISEQDVALSF